MCIAKKVFGTNKSGSNYYDVFKKWLPEEDTNTVVNNLGSTISEWLADLTGKYIFKFGFDSKDDNSNLDHYTTTVSTRKETPNETV